MSCIKTFNRAQKRPYVARLLRSHGTVAGARSEACAPARRPDAAAPEGRALGPSSAPCTLSRTQTTWKAVQTTAHRALEEDGVATATLRRARPPSRVWKSPPARRARTERAIA
jgi:hypothetical protein